MNSSLTSWYRKLSIYKFSAFMVKTHAGRWIRASVIQFDFATKTCRHSAPASHTNCSNTCFPQRFPSHCTRFYTFKTLSLSLLRCPSHCAPPHLQHGTALTLNCFQVDVGCYRSHCCSSGSSVSLWHYYRSLWHWARKICFMLSTVSRPVQC